MSKRANRCESTVGAALHTLCTLLLLRYVSKSLISLNAPSVSFALPSRNVVLTYATIG